MARRALAAIVLVLATGFAGTTTFVLIYDRPAEIPADAVLVVLGGGIRDDGGIGRASAERVAAAVALYKAGTGARLMMTGGTQPGKPAAVAVPMAEAARAAGVPDDAIAVETRSLSTLQNAVLTREMIAPDARVVLITERFHLPRAWASFRWAGFDDLTLYAADAGPVDWSPRLVRQLGLEAVKWPANIGRAGVASLADAVGMPDEWYLPLLD